jgi:hypothetical protein
MWKTATMFSLFWISPVLSMLKTCYTISFDLAISFFAALSFRFSVFNHSLRELLAINFSPLNGSFPTRITYVGIVRNDVLLQLFAVQGQ